MSYLVTFAINKKDLIDDGKSIIVNPAHCVHLNYPLKSDEIFVKYSIDAYTKADSYPYPVSNLVDINFTGNAGGKNVIHDILKPALELRRIQITESITHLDLSANTKLVQAFLNKIGLKTLKLPKVNVIEHLDIAHNYELASITTNLPKIKHLNIIATKIGNIDPKKYSTLKFFKRY